MKLTTLSTFDRRKFFAITFFSIFGAVAPAETCEPTPGNEYEKVFCQLKRGGRGEALPSIHDFRKNPSLVQALLLKKPAERAGILLRIPERANTETVERQADLLLSSAPRPVLTSATEQKSATVKMVVVPKVASKPIRDTVIESRPVSDPLKGCVLAGFELHCDTGRYRLVTNQTNRHLSEDALSRENRLELPVNSGQDRDAYLHQAYGRYLDGMMRIGLGASTLSYTKFVTLYDHIEAQKLDFPARFETMYDFLKRDKSTIGVTTTPIIAENFTTQYCSDVRPTLLACEHQRDNYLFIKINTSG